MVNFYDGRKKTRGEPKNVGRCFGSLRKHLKVDGAMIWSAVYLLLVGSLVNGLKYEDPIKNFHMSNVEPMMAESDMKDVVFKDISDSTDSNQNAVVQPRSVPYTKAERRNYINRVRSQVLRDDSDEFEDFGYSPRGKTASAYDSAEEDYNDDYSYMQRGARRPFQRLRNFFQPESQISLKSAEPLAERPTIFSRFKSFFRPAPSRIDPKPQARMPPKTKIQKQQKKNPNSKYQVLFWPITTTDSDGMVSTNLVPHLVVKNPKREEEILYAVPLVQLAKNSDYNIFQAADQKEINSIKKLKTKSKKTQKWKQKRKNRPPVTDDEVMMEHIIQSGSHVENETTASPPVPSFIFVGDNAETSDSFEDDAELKLRTSGQLQQQQQHNRHRNHRRRYQNSNNKRHW